MQPSVSSFSTYTFFKEKEIPVYMGMLMVCFAGLIDGTQVVLALLGIGEIVDEIIAPCAEIAIFIWFQIYGVSYTKSSNFIFLFFNAIAEEIPIFDAIFPGLTLSVMWLLRQNKKAMRALKIEQERVAQEADAAEQNRIIAIRQTEYAGYSEEETEETPQQPEVKRKRQVVQDIRPAQRKAAG